MRKTLFKERNDFNTLLSLASYNVIIKYKDTTGSPPSGLYFNKMMSIIYNELKEKHRINITLPHCWYRYGDEVVRYLLPHEIRWTHETPYSTIVDWKGSTPYIENDMGVTEVIEKVVNLYTEKYKDRTKEELVDEVYSRAPFDFQRNFRQLRLNVEKFASKTRRVDIENYEKNIILPSLKKAIDSFPRKEFPAEVWERLTRYKEVMESIINLPSFPADISNELTENFWFYFCYYLRIHNKCHENVPSSVVLHWKETIDFQRERYDRNFSDIIIDLVEHYDMPVKGEIHDIYLNRKNEIRKHEDFIEAFFSE